MKLYSKLPYHVTVDGKRYKIKPYYDSILKAIDVLSNEDLTETQKTLILKPILIKSKCKTPVPVINSIFYLLFPQDEKEEEKKIIDFTQDAELIFAGFWQSYNIDLFREQGKLHWLKFSALLSALPNDTRISQIIEIRMQDIPEPTKYNKKQRETLIKLKAKHRIKLSESEQQQLYQKSIHKMAEMLINMAKRGG